MSPRNILWRYKKNAPCPFMEGWIVAENDKMVCINDQRKVWSHHTPIWVYLEEIDVENHP